MLPLAYIKSCLQHCEELWYSIPFRLKSLWRRQFCGISVFWTVEVTQKQSLFPYLLLFLVLLLLLCLIQLTSSHFLPPLLILFFILSFFFIFFFTFAPLHSTFYSSPFYFFPLPPSILTHTAACAFRVCGSKKHLFEEKQKLQSNLQECLALVRDRI